MGTSTYDYKALTSEMISVTDSVKTLTSANVVSGKTKYARINVQGYDVRATWDGTAPVASTTGELWRADSFHDVFGYTNLAAMKFIRESSSSATLSVTYFGYDSIV